MNIFFNKKSIIGLLFYVGISSIGISAVKSQVESVKIENNIGYVDDSVTDIDNCQLHDIEYLYAKNVKKICTRNLQKYNVKAILPHCLSITVDGYQDTSMIYAPLVENIECSASSDFNVLYAPKLKNITVKDDRRYVIKNVYFDYQLLEKMNGYVGNNTSLKIKAADLLSLQSIKGMFFFTQFKTCKYLIFRDVQEVDEMAFVDMEDLEYVIFINKFTKKSPQGSQNKLSKYERKILIAREKNRLQGVIAKMRKYCVLIMSQSEYNKWLKGEYSNKRFSLKDLKKLNEDGKECAEELRKNTEIFKDIGKQFKHIENKIKNNKKITLEDMRQVEEKLRSKGYMKENIRTDEI